MPPTPSSVFHERLQNLRDLLAHQNLDGFLVPMADAFPGDQIAPHAQRLAFLTGFRGSSGLAVVLREEAAFFTDSRYTIQAHHEISQEDYALFDQAQTTPLEWLGSRPAPLASSSPRRLGFDPWLHTISRVRRWREALGKTASPSAARWQLVPLAPNPLDALWQDRPAPPCAPARPHPLVFSGVPSSAKRHAIAEGLKANALDAALIVDPASVAWLLNVRGDDVPYTPLVLSYALLHADARVTWFVDTRKLTAEVCAWLDDEVTCIPLEAMGDSLDSLAGKRVGVDGDDTPEALGTRLVAAKATLVMTEDPCALPRACKNGTEAAGMRAAHQRDGVALVRFLAWLDAQPAGTVSEIDVDTHLTRLRAESAYARGLSFPTIAGAAANGAIVHYRALPETARILHEGCVLLVDSGGQYDDGTTDVTRTVWIGKAIAPPTDLKECFTRVLQGHSALARVVFPSGTTGGDLDVLARAPLWDVGLDYGHGTGHGVGCALSVHEGPQGISRRNTVALASGMVVSNEPGFYREGAWGIRLENLQIVTETSLHDAQGKPFLTFTPLTLVPFDRRLIETHLLTHAERAWIDAYHARVRAEISPLLGEDPFTRVWLDAATRVLE